MLDATPPNPPGRLKRFENLLRELWDASQLRRVIANACGTRVTSQLPEAVSHELLAHGTATVLERNGMITDALFVEFLEERPRMRAKIEEVAREHGIFNLPVIPSPAARRKRIRTASTPDYVVRDTYKSLRRQRMLLRKLTHGELHVARLFDVAIRQQDRALKALPRRVVSWIEKYHHEFSLPYLASTLTVVSTVASMFAVSPEVGLLTSLVGVSTEMGRTAIKQLMSFAESSEQDLYLLALRAAEPREG